MEHDHFELIDTKAGGLIYVNNRLATGSLNEIESPSTPSKPMRPLEAPDSHHVRAAQGWLELGDWRSANSELENIAQLVRAHPDVLEIRWHIHSKAGDWPACVQIARALTKAAPDRASAWIHHAFALHELKRTREAFDVLSPVVARFPAEATIPYNLACYSCQLGDLIGARDWLAQACKLGDAEEWKLKALEDPDLAPLWEGGESGEGVEC